MMTTQIMCSTTDDEILTDSCFTLDRRGCLMRIGRRRTVCCCFDVTGKTTNKQNKTNKKRKRKTAPCLGVRSGWGGGDQFFRVN